MHSPLSELTQIVEKAAFLHERMSADFDPAGQAAHDVEHIVNRRMTDWRKQAAAGDQEHFQRRFEWDGLNGNAAAALRGVRLGMGAALPEWSRVLQASMAGATRHAHTPLEDLEAAVRFLDPADPIPFEHVLIAFVEQCASALKAVGLPGSALLTDTAHIDLERGLLRRLSRAASPTLALEFSAWTSLRSTVPNADERHNYRAFVRDLLADGGLTFFSEYPVLARILAVITLSWQGFIASFLQHLAAEQDDLEAAGLNRKVSGIGSDYSDAHNGGRSVLRVQFAAGRVWFYKPKNIDSEAFFDRLLAWFGEHSPLLPFRDVRRVCRPDHGWAEEAPALPCEDSAGVERYFERLGTLLCILYLFGANDCHFENIIASGEYPVLIDAETLFQPLPNPLPADPRMVSSAAAEAFYHASVLRVGMLPRWKVGKNGRKLDVTTMGGSGGGRGQSSQRVCECANTDRMKFVWKEVQLQAAPVRTGDSSYYAADHVPAIERGFTAAYCFLLSHRDGLAQWLETQSGLAQLPLRYLVRNTYVYGGIINTLLRPQFLKDGVDAGIQAEVLARRFLYAGEKPQAWPVVAAERRSILGLDIPRFSCTPGDCGLQLDEQTRIDGYFTEPSLGTVTKALGAMGASDLALQVSYIRYCFGRSTASATGEVTARGAIAPLEPIGSGDLVEQANRIAWDMNASAIRESENSVVWISHAYNPEGQFWQLQPMGLRFYDGVCGAGLFLAALERITGGAGYRSLALAAFHRVMSAESKQLRNWLLREGLGAGAGITSIVYTLLRAGLLLEEEPFLRQACRVADWITPDFIRADAQLDLISGAGGGALALLALHEATAHGPALELAAVCGDHLLAKREATPAGPRAWRTVQGKFLAGYSHGAAGIIHALAKLSAATGDQRYRGAALEACEYENGIFSEEERNWPHLLIKSKDGRAVFWNAWCHGAPGIGLGRIRGLPWLDTPAIRRDIEHSLYCASELPLNALDHPCCGTLGRMEVLLEAASRMGSPRHLDRARVIAANVVGQARDQGRYSVGLNTDLYLASFHQGMAGIGYQLLRAAYPESLPSALSFQ